MKIFQIVGGICHLDVTRQFPTLDATKGRFAPNILFVEAPDNVHEGWGYINGEFIHPEIPEGWLYDENTGTFYPETPVEPEPVIDETVLVLDLLAEQEYRICMLELGGN